MAKPVAVRIKKTQMQNYILPRLVHYDYDLNKRWYVVFYVPHEKNPKLLVRKRVSHDINYTDNEQVRIYRAKAIIDYYTNMLHQGAVHEAREEPEAPQEPEDEQDEGVNPLKITLTEAIAHVRNKKKQTMREGSNDNYTSLFNALQAFLKERAKPGLRLKEAGSPILHSFFDWMQQKRKLSNKTYNNYHITLHAVYNYFCNRYPRQFPRNLVKKVARLPVETGDAHKPFTDKQVALIKQEIIRREDWQLLLFVEFLYYGFLRPRKEARLIKVEYLKEKTIFIPASISKNKTAEHIVIPPGLEKAIQRQGLREYPGRFYVFSASGKPGEKPVAETYFYKRHKEVLEAVGLYGGDYDMYGYKHTGNINLFKSGADLKHLQEQNRHLNIAQTYTYIRQLGLLRDKNAYDNFPEL